MTWYSQAALVPLLDANVLDETQASEIAGPAATALALELRRIGGLGMPGQWTRGQGLKPEQAEGLRKLLVALAADVRLVLVRLALQLARLRTVKNASRDEQVRAALETREIYAPLANRLGIWQLKWELEDLAFRYCEPDDYQPYRRLAARDTRGARAITSRTCATSSDATLARCGCRRQRSAGGRSTSTASGGRCSASSCRSSSVMDVLAVRDQGRHGRRLLCGARPRARTLAVHPGRVRRLHRDSQGEQLPLPPHRGHRARQPAARDPDPHAGDARARRARRRRALAVQGRSALEAAYQQKINWLRQLLDPPADATTRSRTCSGRCNRRSSRIESMP